MKKCVFCQKKLLLFPIFCFVELISAIKALFGNQFLGCRASSCNVLGAWRVIYTKYGPLKKKRKNNFCESDFAEFIFTNTGQTSTVF